MTKSEKSHGAPKGKHFEATLERMRSRLNWVIARIPFDAKKVWGERGQIRVRGEINGFSFRTSLFPTGDGRHILLVNTRMQKGSGARAGHSARFHLELDTEERVALNPEPLHRLLVQDRALFHWYEQLNHSTRMEIGKWVSAPKSPEAQARRAEQMAERLLETMEAERDLPPLLRLAFERNAKAHEGWRRMAPGRRRQHLLGIFGYRSPDSRMRRIQKMLDEAVALAERNA